MLPKLQNAYLTAAHAMKQMENKESMLKELDISASMEISRLLKILNSTNSAEPKKPQEVKDTNPPTALLTTKDQRN